jgi:hypothetical protein
MKIDKYAQEILKTGFILENKIADTLRSNNWTVISNKYYEDDFEGSVREIDLLAYKVNNIQNISMYTTLLISCKKSDANIWALLARKINIKDPNSDWWPLHAWSNDNAINFELSKSGLAKKYHDEIIKLGVQEALSTPEFEVFAFQEMNRVSGTPQNDKNIFNSLTSLMKAQAYELGALSQRKKSPSIYQFNLISVIDSDLIRLNIEGDNISQTPIESEHYISRYIIKRNETFSRIRFIKASCFKDKLKDYNRLHEANCRWFDHACNAFYNEILKDQKRVSIFIENFIDKIKWHINFVVREKFNKEIGSHEISVEWDSKEHIPLVTLIFETEETIEVLNNDSKLKKRVSAALKDVYRYEGEFRFSSSDNIPF